MKKRIDLILVEKKIVESRTKAQIIIKAGQVYVDEKKVLKSGELHNPKSKVNYKNSHPIWVSRGALKLLHALDKFEVDVSNFNCLDIGASTGGFTEVLLSRKAGKVFSVDVGINQLHEKLIKNPNVINISKTNARYLNKNIIYENIDMIVCDVSFISMKKVIEPSLPLLDKKKGIIIALIKPQFESSKSEIKKGGVIIDSAVHERICSDYICWFELVCKMKVLGIIPSPIKGPKGNLEFLIYVKR